MNTPLISALFALALFFGWSQLLLHLAKSRRNRRTEFYLLLFAPKIIMAIILLVVAKVFILENMIWFLVLMAVLAIYYIGWAKTLYKLASDEKILWFYGTLLISPLWIAYIALEEI